MRWPASGVVLAVVGILSTGGSLSSRAPEPAGTTDIAQLWIDPVDLGTRDLRAGPGGSELQPDAAGDFAFVAHKTSGVNPGYDVRDRSGRLWSVKLGEEAQSEVTVSRILWAMGFHQPPVYYLPRWTLTGTDAGVKSGARFRPEEAGWTATAEWSWYENAFVDRQEFRGLIVAQMLVANWDLKTSNNRVYEVADAAAAPRRRYVVRDLGSSLGSARQHPFFAFLGTRGQQGTKNDIAGFERRGFITEVDDGRVEFDYRGMNEALLSNITPADVVWACELAARLTAAQWEAAFDAGGYSPELRGRFVAKIQEKIAQGLALRSRLTTRN